MTLAPPSYCRFLLRVSLVLVAIGFLTPCVAAQKITYTWSPENKLAIGAGAGATKYFGEFTDQNFGTGAQFHAKYFFLPEIALQLDGGFGTYVYNRRLRDEFKDAYTRQFYRDPQLLGLTPDAFAMDFCVSPKDPAKP